MASFLHYLNDLIHARFAEFFGRCFCHYPYYWFSSGLAQENSSVITQTVCAFFHFSLNGFIILCSLLIFYSYVFST